jgi:hypothetical protein
MRSSQSRSKRRALPAEGRSCLHLCAVLVGSRGEPHLVPARAVVPREGISDERGVQMTNVGAIAMRKGVVRGWAGLVEGLVEWKEEEEEEEKDEEEEEEDRKGAAAASERSRARGSWRSARQSMGRKGLCGGSSRVELRQGACLAPPSPSAANAELELLTCPSPHKRLSTSPRLTLPLTHPSHPCPPSSHSAALCSSVCSATAPRSTRFTSSARFPPSTGAAHCRTKTFETHRSGTFLYVHS